MDSNYRNGVTDFLDIQSFNVGGHSYNSEDRLADRNYSYQFSIPFRIEDEHTQTVSHTYRTHGGCLNDLNITLVSLNIVETGVIQKRITPEKQIRKECFESEKSSYKNRNVLDIDVSRLTFT